MSSRHATAEATAEALLAALRQKKSRVIDIFRTLDHDASGTVDKKEFREVVSLIKDLNFNVSDIDDVFDWLDDDGSGSLDLNELDRLMRLGYQDRKMRKEQQRLQAEVDQVSQRSRAQMQRQRQKFDEADANGDKKLSFDEFLAILPAHTRARYSEDKILKWFHLADVNGSGTLSLEEFFSLSLGASTQKLGVGLKDMFLQYDVNFKGRLGEKDFVQAVVEMGFGDIAHKLYNELPKCPKGTVDYMSLLPKLLGHAHSAKEGKPLLVALTWEGQGTSRDSSTDWSLESKTVEDTRVELASLMQRHGVQASELFALVDSEGSTLISQNHFNQVMTDQLGFKGEPDVLYEIWDAIDVDGGGRISFYELSMWLDGQIGRSSYAKSTEQSTKESKSPKKDRGSMSRQERARAEILPILSRGGLQPTSVVNGWDETGNGLVSQARFWRNMKKLIGDETLWYTTIRSAVSEAFHAINVGLDGMVDIGAFCNWLDNNSDKFKAGKGRVTQAVEEPSTHQLDEPPAPTHAEEAANGTVDSGDRPLSYYLNHLSKFQEGGHRGLHRGVKSGATIQLSATSLDASKSLGETLHLTEVAKCATLSLGQTSPPSTKSFARAYMSSLASTPTQLKPRELDRCPSPRSSSFTMQPALSSFGRGVVSLSTSPRGLQPPSEKVAVVSQPATPAQLHSGRVTRSAAIASYKEPSYPTSYGGLR